MVTKEQAQTEREFHENGCVKIIGPRGGVTQHIYQWRASGQCKTWVTRPEEFRLPIKYGLYYSDSITERNADQFHTSSSCRPQILSYVQPALTQQVSSGGGLPCTPNTPEDNSQLEAGPDLRSGLDTDCYDKAVKAIIQKVRGES